MQQKINRRNFIKLSSIAGTGLILGCTSKSPKLLSINDVNKNELGLWVRIGDDESITLVVPSVEMGQHIHTGQAMLLAEELEVNWDSINQYGELTIYDISNDTTNISKEEDKK